MPVIDTAYSTLAMIAVAAYLLGSIPFGMVIARVFGLGNLRDIGSGNIGATNVLRTGNKAAAALTLIFDALKGAIAVLVARQVAGEEAAQIAGLCAFLGHLFPIWLGFRGGKGVATFLGVALALFWQIGIAACLTWLAAAFATRISSYGALVAAATTGLYAFVFGYFQGLLIFTILAVLVFIRHAGNIRRIKAGTEPKIGQSEQSGSPG